jgi:hypothetical protein
MAEIKGLRERESVRYVDIDVARRGEKVVQVKTPNHLNPKPQALY